MSMSKNNYQDIISFMEKVNFAEIDFDELLSYFDSIFGYNQSIFWLCDTSYNLKPIAQLNIDEKAANEYNIYYHKLDNFWHPRNINPWPKMKSVLNIFDVIDEHHYEKTTLYNEFYKKYKHHHMMTMYLFYKEIKFGFITFTRQKQEKPFSMDDRNQLEVISRFLSNKIWNSLSLDEEHLSQAIKNYSSLDLHTFLTPKEKEILELVQKGLTNNDVSKALYISTNTVKTHLLNIYRKMNVSNRTELCYITKLIKLKL